MKNNIIDLKRVESSPVEPCTLAQLKAQAIITFSDDDTLLNSLIIKARKVIENYCNISIVYKTITLIADLFNEWELPYGPVTGIVSVQTPTGTQGSGPPNYETVTSGWNQEGEEFISFVPAGTVFQTIKPSGTRYRIVYTAGYSVVPDDLIQAVLAQATWLYEHRGEGTEAICEQAQKLADPYIRVLWL